MNDSEPQLSANVRIGWIGDELIGSGRLHTGLLSQGEEDLFTSARYHLPDTICQIPSARYKHNLYIPGPAWSPVLFDKIQTIHAGHVLSLN